MGRKYYKLVYYREKPNIIDTRNFRSVDEFNDWYKRQMEIEPVRILSFCDVFIPAYEKESD